MYIYIYIRKLKTILGSLINLPGITIFQILIWLEIDI